jgi:colicin import membrane protein
MRIGPSGVLVGMAALLLGTARASAQDEPREPVAAEEESQQEIVGDVQSADRQEVLVSVRGEPELRLQLRPRTVVLVDGQMATADDIREGQGIRALYRFVEDEPVAFVVEVTNQPQGQ